jgi:hypothetical protein
MKKQILSISILISALAFSFVLIHNAAAQSSFSSSPLSNITYPIIELGNCTDQASCKTYCDNPDNTSACVDFADKNNIFTKEEVATAKKFIAVGSKGPGECKGKDECQTYCEDTDHIDECVSFAESSGLMSQDELKGARKVQAAIKKGVKLPACKNKKECDTYCEDASHMEECINFAQEAGLISGKELQDSQKVLNAVKQGVTPPPCRGKDACDVYCADESHIDECTNFAVAAGLITADEARVVKETGGKGPGGCKNKSECDTFCSSPDNRAACSAFAEEHGLTPPGQGGEGDQGGPDGQSGPGGPDGQGGPGGQGGPSGGPNEGQGFNPGSGQGGGQSQGANPNPVKCIEDCELAGRNCVSQVDNGQKQTCEDNNKNCNENCNQNVCQDKDGVPHNVAACNSCFSQCVSSGKPCWDIAVAENSACTTTKDQCVGQCQKDSKPSKPLKLSAPNQPNQPVQPGNNFQPGPGATNPGGQGLPPQSGPGGCQGPMECQAYCASHQAECQAFKQQQKALGQPGQQPQQPQQPSGPQGGGQPPSGGPDDGGFGGGGPGSPGFLNQWWWSLNN